MGNDKSKSHKLDNHEPKILSESIDKLNTIILNHDTLNCVLKHGIESRISIPYTIIISTKSDDVIFDQNDYALQQQLKKNNYYIIRKKTHKQNFELINKIIKDVYNPKSNIFDGIIVILMCIVRMQRDGGAAYYYDINGDKTRIDKLSKNIKYRMNDSENVYIHYSDTTITDLYYPSDASRACNEEIQDNNMINLRQQNRENKSDICVLEKHSNNVNGNSNVKSLKSLPNTLLNKLSSNASAFYSKGGALSTIFESNEESKFDQSVQQTALTICNSPVPDQNCEDQYECDEKTDVISSKKKKIKKKQNIHYSATYEPKTSIRAKWNVYVSRNMTKNIIPSKIRETFNDLYSQIDIETAMQFNDSKIDDDADIKILNFGFHDKESGEILYCIIEKQARKTPWKMKERTFTGKEIINEFKLTQLPTASRSNFMFQTELKQGNDIKILLKSDGQRKKFITNTKWHKIKIFCKLNHTRRTTLSMTTNEFIKDLKQNTNFNNLELIPILMFYDTYHRVVHLWIVTIHQNVNIAISLIYNKGTIEATGIHIERSLILKQHQWISTVCNSNECKCLNILNIFASSFNCIVIGNPDSDKNRIKDLEKRNSDLLQIISNLESERAIK